MVMLVRLEQSRNPHSPISFTDGGMVMLVRLEQSRKAHPLIFVTPSVITKEVNCLGSSFRTDTRPSALVRLEQPEKALFPIFVTDGGMEMLVRLEQR